jgi:hypothetical protein
MERRAWWILVFGLSVIIAPLAQAAEPLPEFFGFYAVSNGQLIELKKSGSSPDVGSGVRFIVFQNNFTPQAGKNLVSRMLYLRRKIDPEAQTPNKTENRWYRAEDSARDIELRAKPIAGQSQMIMLVPTQPLASGAYAVTIGNDYVASIYVDKAAVLRNLEKGDDCVDHIYEAMGKQFSWSTMDRRMAGMHQVVRCSQSMTPQERLSSLMTELTRRPLIAPPIPDIAYAERRCGANFSYPSDWEFSPRDQGVILAFVNKPADVGSTEAGTMIYVTCSVGGSNLDTAVSDTIDGTRKGFKDATIAGPIETRLAGFKASMFFFTATEDTKQFRQKAVTVAVRDGKVLGLVLSATPETFEDAWDEYQRMAASYSVPGPAVQHEAAGSPGSDVKKVEDAQKRLDTPDYSKCTPRQIRLGECES